MRASWAAGSTSAPTRAVAPAYRCAVRSGRGTAWSCGSARTLFGLDIWVPDMKPEPRLVNVGGVDDYARVSVPVYLVDDTRELAWSATGRASNRC